MKIVFCPFLLLSYIKYYMWAKCSIKNIFKKYIDYLKYMYTTWILCIPLLHSISTTYLPTQSHVPVWIFGYYGLLIVYTHKLKTIKTILVILVINFKKLSSINYKYNCRNFISIVYHMNFDYSIWCKNHYIRCLFDIYFCE